MNDLIFQKLKSTVDGVGATTGKQTEKAFNENFDLVKNLFTEVLSALAITVTSGELKQIKVDTSTTPYTLYYSLDDESNENPTWIKLLQFGFSQLTGSPYDSISLKNVLDTKANTVTTDSIALQITGINNDIFSINTEISGLKNADSNLRAEITRLDNADSNIKTSIQNLKLNELADLTTEDARLQSEIDALKLVAGETTADLSRVVFTEEGSSLWIRYNPDNNELQASTNSGKTWLPVGALSLEWRQLKGDPALSTTLDSFVTTKLETALSQYITKSLYSTHVDNLNNPHKVTAAQLGLGNVLELVNNINQSEIVQANVTSYIKHNNEIPDKAYFLSSHFGRVKLTIEGNDFFEFVKTLNDGESYELVDGTMISKDSYEKDPESVPVYYRVSYNTADPNKLDIYYNEELYNYIRGGGVLD